MALLLAACTSSSADDTTSRSRLEGAKLGAALYTNCSACHGPEGQGHFGPPLANDPNLADADVVVAKILRGSANMPAFAGTLDAAEVAAVATHVRNSWGNAMGPVSTAEVERVTAGFDAGGKTDRKAP